MRTPKPLPKYPTINITERDIRRWGLFAPSAIVIQHALRESYGGTWLVDDNMVMQTNNKDKPLFRFSKKRPYGDPTPFKARLIPISYHRKSAP